MEAVDRKRFKKKYNGPKGSKKGQGNRSKKEYPKKSYKNPRPRSNPKSPVTDEGIVKSIEKLDDTIKKGDQDEVKKDFVRVVGHFNRIDGGKYNDKYKAIQNTKTPSVTAILGILPLIVLGLATIGLKHQNLVAVIAKGFKEFLNRKEEPKSPLEVLSYKKENRQLKIIGDAFDKIFEAFKKVDTLEKLVIVSSFATIIVDEIPMLVRSLGSLPNVSLTAKVNESLSKTLALTRSIQKATKGE